MRTIFIFITNHYLTISIAAMLVLSVIQYGHIKLKNRNLTLQDVLYVLIIGIGWPMAITIMVVHMLIYIVHNADKIILIERKKD